MNAFYRDRRTTGSYRHIRARRVPICLQMFVEGIESTADDGRQARDLLEILDESLETS